MSRQGYRLFREAQAWLGRRVYVDLSKSLGGVLASGTHRKVEVLELIQGPHHKWADVIFGYEAEGSSFRQRFFQPKCKYFKLGQKYDIRIAPIQGTHLIVLDSSREYKLIHRIHKKLVFSSKVLEEVKRYAREHCIIIAKPTITWWSLNKD